MVTRRWFAGLSLPWVLQRLFELRLSQRNERRMRQRVGASMHPRRIAGSLPCMPPGSLRCCWKSSSAGAELPLPPPAALAFSLFAAGQALRLTAIRTLGWRWSTRVMTVPGPEGAPVQRGIYRYIRHPNYLGVELEILAVPLLHTRLFTSARVRRRQRLAAARPHSLARSRRWMSRAQRIHTKDWCEAFVNG